MLETVIGAVLGLVLGAVVGFWMRGRELGAARAEIERLRQESGARAGYEALAAERSSAISRMTADVESLRAEMQGRIEAERKSAARIGELEAALRADQEKLTLLDEALQSSVPVIEQIASNPQAIAAIESSLSLIPGAGPPIAILAQLANVFRAIQAAAPTTPTANPATAGS